MDFCQICDRPYPITMLSDGICAACWSEHADHDLVDQPLMQAWARDNAAFARGPLLLAPPMEAA